MRSTNAPALASWFLRHFGCSPNNQSVIGDLNEGYRHGRSRLWYWKQVAHAIPASFLYEISSHKLLSIRALLIGWIVKVIWLSAYLYEFRKPGAGIPATRLFSDGIEPSSFVILIGVFAIASSGWIITQTHRSQYRAMVLLYINVELVGSLLSFITRSAVFGFFYWMFPLSQTIYALFAHFGVFDFIAALWASLGITVIGILFGAGFFRRDRDDASPELNSASA